MNEACGSCGHDDWTHPHPRGRCMADNFRLGESPQHDQCICVAFVNSESAYWRWFYGPVAVSR